MNEKIVIIIPAYNEEKNITKVIESLSSLNIYADLFIINDGSTDNTSIVVKKTQKAELISLKKNLGIGGAVQTGFKIAKIYNYDIAVQFDGDGQHNAYEILKLIEPLNANEADVVVGSRFINNNGFRSTFLRRIGIKLFEILNLLLINQKIKDNTSGFRAYNKRAIDFLADNYPQDYPEPEAIILLGRNNFRIKEIPTLMNIREHGKSSISGLISVYYMIKVILSIFITFLRKRERK